MEGIIFADGAIGAHGQFPDHNVEDEVLKTVEVE